MTRELTAKGIVGWCLLGFGCSAPQLARIDTLPWPDTTTADWVSTSIERLPITPGTRVTLRTSPTGAGGYTGCNWYGVRRDSGQVLIEMTARGCRPEIQEQERRFTRDSISGYGGCRDLEGTWMAQEDRLRVTYLSMRQMDCPRDRARVPEEELTTALSETEHFALRGDTLLFTTWGGDTLRWRRAR